LDLASALSTGSDTLHCTSGILSKKEGSDCCADDGSVVGSSLRSKLLLRRTADTKKAAYHFVFLLDDQINISIGCGRKKYMLHAKNMSKVCAICAIAKGRVGMNRKNSHAPPARFTAEARLRRRGCHDEDVK
jgi:hypothetical protein